MAPAPDEKFDEQLKAGVSSVEVNVNAKGEPSFKVKVYVGTTQEALDDTATQVVGTMVGLREGRYGRL
jgi:hypothetical protein